MTTGSIFPLSDARDNTSIIARKGLRPTKRRPVPTVQEETMKLRIARRGYKTIIRMFKEVFCIKIWTAKPIDIKQEDKIWALLLTTQTQDDRLRAVEAV